MLIKNLQYLSKTSKKITSKIILKNLRFEPKNLYDFNTDFLYMIIIIDFSVVDLLSLNIFRLILFDKDIKILGENERIAIISKTTIIDQ